VQRLQHQSVAAERHHDLGLARRHLAVAVAQHRRRVDRVGCFAGDDRDPGHERLNL
jgi:hypothetical protein